jgi:hypothetical protein
MWRRHARESEFSLRTFPARPAMTDEGIFGTHFATLPNQMIARRAFEAFAQRQLAGHDTISLKVEALRANGWDTDTLRELITEYMEVPARSRRFCVEWRDDFGGAVIVWSRNTSVVA